MRPVASVLVALLLLTSGCVAQPAGPESEGTAGGSTESPDGQATAVPSTTTAAPTPSARIDSELRGLREATNRTEYARTHGLTLDNGSVEVVAVLKPGTDPPSSIGQLELVHDEEAVMTVPVDRIGSLADHRNVTYVRTPNRPVADR